MLAMQRRSDVVDHHLLKNLGSSLVDFHTSTLSWLLLRGVPLFKSRFHSKPGPVTAKAKEAFIVQYPRLISDEPIIRMSDGQPDQTSSGHKYWLYIL